ncbi:MAG: NAD-dependent epimerase/dehydratase family protein [Candidatus Ratteibacteria bacterium]|nr:NAD-dependent epimerase/dehydratase family protein [Candidatus Ratteibacteria bacterium]
MKKTDKILVTGGAGFIGGHLVDKLVSVGERVSVLDNFSGSIQYQNDKADYIYKYLDVRNFAGKERFDYIFHLAAIPRVMKSIKSPLKTNDTNINGTLNMLEYARKNKAKKFIFVSSSSVYGDQEIPLRENMVCKPRSPYGLQKRTGEEYCRLYYELFGLESVIIRPFNVYGPRMDLKSDYAGVIGRFLYQKSRKQSLTICGDGKQTRDFTYVGDVIKALMYCIEKPVGGAEIINIGAGFNISVNFIANIIGGKTKNVEARPNEPRDTLADITKAKNLLGWSPDVRINDGINKIINYGISN